MDKKGQLTSIIYVLVAIIIIVLLLRFLFGII